MANAIWAIDQQQKVYWYDTTTQQWVNIQGAYLAQIAVGFDGAVWGVNSQGSLYQWMPGTQTFNFMGEGVTNAAVGSESAVFAANANGGATYWYF